MAYYGRRYRRYRKYRRFYRRYRRRGAFNYARKYVNSSSRSNIRMKTSVTTTLTSNAGYGDSATSADVSYFNTLAGNNDKLSAANSPLYQTYCNLYEECKVIGLKVSLAVASAIGGSDIPSLQIYTAWDRKHGSGEPAMTASDIKNASTYNVATALNNNVAKLSRSLFASDLMEKATWFDATLDSSHNYRNEAWVAAGTNPNMFCPSLFWFFNCPSKAATQQVSFSVSVTYYFAFRNPRYGGGGSAKLADLGARSLVPDEGGDMDDDAPMVLPPLPDSDGDLSDDGEAPPAAEAAAATVNKQRRNAQRTADRETRRRARIVDPVLRPKN